MRLGEETLASSRKLSTLTRNGTITTAVLTGHGTTGYISKWTSATGLGDSILSDNGTTATCHGIFTSTGAITGSNLSGTNTGDETAARIRALGFFDVTNDGSGSGLDADLLDGHDTSYFATSGSVPVGANPTGTIGLSTVNGSAATFLRSDAAPPLSVAITPTWTNVHTFSSQDVHQAGISLGIAGTATSGRINSAVTTAAGAIGIYLKPTNTLTGSDRWVFRLDDATGNTLLSAYEGGPVEFGGIVAGTNDAMVSIVASTAKNGGIFFAPAAMTGSGQTFMSVTGMATGAYFKSIGNGASTSLTGGQVAGVFEGSNPAGAPANLADTWGAWFRAQGNSAASSNSTRTWARTGGFKVFPALTAKNFGTFTDVYGGYISNVVSTAATTGLVVTNTYGLYVEEQTKGGTINNGIFLANATADRKLLALGDQSSYLSGRSNSGTPTLDIATTDLYVKSTKLGFYSVTPVARPAAYTPTNVTTDRSYDANSTTVDELADVLGTLIADLQSLGLVT